MNAFEDIVALYLNEEGYWVKQSVKIEISKEDKVQIGLPTMPRPEIDLVAMDVKHNTLLLIEVKSFLDSPGVRFIDVSGQDFDGAERYKLFTNEKFREIVSKKILEDYLGKGLVNLETKVNYVLATGKILSGDTEKIASLFNNKGWLFITPDEIKAKIRSLSEKHWEDNVVVMAAKLILRN